MTMTNLVRPLGFLLIGSLAGAGATYWLAADTSTAPTAETIGPAKQDKEPLYWVAPMDPGFRRDKPGKSPMGMDLVPVYADGQSQHDGPGTVRVSPSVVNNLGVQTEPVITGRLPSSITTVGYVQYNEDEMTHVHPRVEGWIETLAVKAEGEPIEEGKPLYTLYSPTLVNAQEEFILALNRQNGRLINAAEERLKSLNVSTTLIQQLRKNRQVQRTTTVYAPATGVIDNLNVREGMYTKPGERVLSIASLDEVWVMGEVFERQLPSVQRQNRAVMTLDYMPGREWVGHVDYLYPEVDPKTRTARVRMRFDNTDGVLRPGMFAQLNIKGERGERRLLVAREAIIRTGHNDRLVLALEDGAFKSVEVTVGRVGEQYAEVLEGVMPADTVVTSAQFLIDSESSKTSDFRRMARPAANAHNHSADSVTNGTNTAGHNVPGSDALEHGETDDEGMIEGEMGQGEMAPGDTGQGRTDHGEIDHSVMDHGGDHS